VITARRLYQEEFEFSRRGKLWFAANDAPRLNSDDDAIWRRLIRVPFSYTVPFERRNPLLKKRLRKWESDGKLSIPEVVRQSTEEYRKEMDPLTDFIDECCELDPGNTEFRETSERLFKSYQEWGIKKGLRYPLKKSDFGRHLRQFGIRPIQIGSNRARGYAGICLRVSELKNLTNKAL